MNGVERYRLKSDRPNVIEYWERDASGKGTAYCSAAAFLKLLLPIERKVFAAIYRLADIHAEHDDYVVYDGCVRDISRTAGLEANITVWGMLLLARHRVLTTRRGERRQRLFLLNLPLDGPQEMQRASSERRLDAIHMVSEMLGSGDAGRPSGSQVKVLLTLARHAKTEGGRYFIRNKRAVFLCEQSGMKKAIFYRSIRVLERKGVVRAERFSNAPSVYELVRPHQRQAITGE